MRSVDKLNQELQMVNGTQLNAKNQYLVKKLDLLQYKTLT